MDITHSFNESGDLVVNVPKEVFNPSSPPSTNSINELIQNAITNKTYKVELENKDYLISSTVIVKQGVELIFQRKTRFLVYGNFNVIELERDAMVINPNIYIDSTDFNSAAIYVDGKHKFINSWFRAGVVNPIINNWSGSYKGIGIHCYANGENHEVSFVNFENAQILGMETAIKLEALKPTRGVSYVNANRFTNLTIDDCVNFIQLSSGLTVPNECSGNQFTNMQLQPSSKTKMLFNITGMNNQFSGMVWDLAKITTSNTIVFLSTTSSKNIFTMRNFPTSKVTDNGVGNIY